MQDSSLKEPISPSVTICCGSKASKVHLLQVAGRSCMGRHCSEPQAVSWSQLRCAPAEAGHTVCLARLLSILSQLHTNGQEQPQGTPAACPCPPLGMLPAAHVAPLPVEQQLHTPRVSLLVPASLRQGGCGPAPSAAAAAVTRLSGDLHDAVNTSTEQQQAKARSVTIASTEAKAGAACTLTCTCGLPIHPMQSQLFGLTLNN